MLRRTENNSSSTGRDWICKPNARTPPQLISPATAITESERSLFEFCLFDHLSLLQFRISCFEILLCARDTALRSIVTEKPISLRH